MEFLNKQLVCIQTWLTLLTEDEVYIIEWHLIDGIDIPRIAAEYQKRWGDEYAKTDRTITATKIHGGGRTAVTVPVQHIIVRRILKIRLRCARSRSAAGAGRKALIGNRTIYTIQFVVEYDTISSIISIALTHNCSV